MTRTPRRRNLRRALLTLTALAALSVPSGAALAQPAVDPGQTTLLPAGLRQGRVIFVRPGRVQIVRDSVLVQTYRTPGELDLATLAALVHDPDYAVTTAAGVLQLRAVLAARPGTTISASDPGLTRIELGDAGAGAARFIGTSSTVHLTGITVAPLATSAGGPRTPGYLQFSNSSVTLERTILSGLGNLDPRQAAKHTVAGGAAPANAAGGAPAATGKSLAHAALRTLRGTVSITDSSVTAGAAGLLLTDPTSLTLQGVTARSTGGTGITIQSPSSATLSNVTAVGDHGDGMVVGGTGAQIRVTGPVTVSGNTRNGLVLTDVTGARLSQITTTGNAGAGMRLVRVHDAVLTGAHSNSDHTGVSVESSGQVSLNGVVVNGANTGVSVKASRTVRMAGLQVTGRAPVAGVVAGQVGIGLSGDDIQIRDTTSTGTTEGIVVAGDARGVVVQGGHFDASRTGARVDSTTPTTLDHVTLSSSSGSALRVSGRGLSVTGATMTGGQGITVRGAGAGLALRDTSVDAHGTALDTGAQTAPITVQGGQLTGHTGPTLTLGGGGATLTGTTVTAAAGSTTAIDMHAPLTGREITVHAAVTGIRLTGTSTATIEHSSITAGSDGIAAGREASARLIETTVAAGRPSRGKVTFIGENRYSHEPLRWLAVAALIAIVAALALEVMRRLRDRRQPPTGIAPEHVLNAR
jgi:hypothetical protein